MVSGPEVGVTKYFEKLEKRVAMELRDPLRSGDAQILLGRELYSHGEWFPMVSPSS